MRAVKETTPSFAHCPHQTLSSQTISYIYEASLSFFTSDSQDHFSLKEINISHDWDSYLVVWRCSPPRPSMCTRAKLEAAGRGPTRLSVQNWQQTWYWLSQTHHKRRRWGGGAWYKGTCRWFLTASRVMAQSHYSKNRMATSWQLGKTGPLSDHFWLEGDCTSCLVVGNLSPNICSLAWLSATTHIQTGKSWQVTF